MFICAVTRKVSSPGEAQNKIVVKSRQKVYKNWDNDQEEYWESFGTEIVKEVAVSEEGLAIWKALKDDERDLLSRAFCK